MRWFRAPRKTTEQEALRESEERYRTLFASIEDGFCLVQVLFDETGAPVDYLFLQANPSFTEHTRLVNAVGRTALELVPGLERRWIEIYGRVALTGEPLRFENYSEAMGGQWFEVFAFRFGRSERRQVAIFFKNVTERKRTELRAQESEERLRLALAIAEMGTFEIDLKTDAVTVNEAGRAIYGWAPDEPLTFAKVQTYFHPDDREEVMRRVEAAFDPDGPGEFQVEQRIFRMDGAVRWIRVRGRALFEPAGEGPRQAVRCLGTYLDVTDQKEAEQEREQVLAAERNARAEAEQASRMKDEFLATVSHELRTPLNAMLGWALLLARKKADERTLRQGLSVIERNARAQAQLIEDLLDMSRIISGKIGLDVQSVDLYDVIAAAIETARPGAEAKDIRIEQALDPDAGEIRGDPHRLQQVVWNLLSNAVKFTPRGGQVQVVLERVGSHAELTVADTGQGIQPEFLPFVFDRFRQADASSTRRHSGLGLGLSIVKQLVELHGGRVRAESPGEGRGATFVVELPVAAVHEPLPLNPPASSQGESHEALCEALSLSRITVLAVDDEPDALSLIRRVLEECDARVLTAKTASEALDLLRREHPDVLLSDIGMPGMDGYELIRRVRALAPEAGGDVPAAALTAFARSEDRTRAALAGYQTHLTKPVQPNELLAIVASLAGRVGKR